MHNENGKKKREGTTGAGKARDYEKYSCYKLAFLSQLVFGFFKIGCKHTRLMKVAKHGKGEAGRRKKENMKGF